MSKESYELQRTESICTTPEEQLLKYVKENNTRKIKSLIAANSNLLNKQYDEPYNKTIIQLACYDHANEVKPATIKTLLDLKADIYLPSEIYQGKETLHFATLSDNIPILETVTEHIKKTKPEKLNSVAEGDTALLVLIKEGDSSSKHFLKTAEILLKYGLDVNKADRKNVTPILYAATKNNKDLVELLVKQKDIDLDNHVHRGKTAREWITQKNLVKGELPPPVNNNFSRPEELFKLLRMKQEDQFTDEVIEEEVDLDDGTDTLLQVCSQLNLVLSAEVLLSKKATPTKITKKNKKTPLEIAAREGHFQIVELLVDESIDVNISELLMFVLKMIDQPETEGCSYKECFKILSEKNDYRESNLNWNWKDEGENTLLHYAARYSDEDTTLVLLNKGASLGNKNVNGYLPIEDIDADILEKHFDHCITANEKITSRDSTEFTVTFHYNTLVPTTNIPDKNVDDSTVEEGTTNTYTPLHIRNSDVVPEMRVINYIAKTPELRKLLQHPLLTSFIYLKWNKLCWYFYLNFFFYCAVWWSLIPYIFMSYNHASYEQKSDAYKVLVSILYVIVWVTFVILIMKEVCQALLSPKIYIRQIENYLEVSLIILIGLMLLLKDPADDTRKQISAILILLISFQVVLLIGQWPKMSTSIIMLRTVSYSFFKFFLWHFILIFAFALSFYTLFNSNSDDVSEKVATQDPNKEEEDKSFDDPGVSFFKTFIMITGEFDAGNINFDSFPITSRILFGVFVFMIVMVLFNLLNGLAVSDTTQIKNEAVIFSYKNQVEHICYIENMLLGNIFPSSMSRFFERFLCCFPKITPEIFLPLGIPNNACLFPEYIKDFKLAVYLNKSGQVKPEGGQIKSTVSLNKKTIKCTRQIIRDRYKEEKNDQSKVLEKLVSVIENQKKDIEELMKQVHLISQSLKNNN